jgi:hypothetical protein
VICFISVFPCFFHGTEIILSFLFRDNENICISKYRIVTFLLGDMRRKQVVLFYVLLKIVERVSKTGFFTKQIQKELSFLNLPFDSEQRNETGVSSIVMHIHKLPESILVLETGQSEPQFSWFTSRIS